MKPVRFTYRRPHSLGEALELLADSRDARILAGGQSLVPLLNMRLARPAVLVDITRIPELATLEVDGRGLWIGAAVRLSSLIASTLVAEHAPLLAAAARHVGHRAIRNRGTLGGSLAHADPAAELPAAMVAMGGEIVVAGPGPTLRHVPAAEFVVGPFLTLALPTELVCEVKVPDQRGLSWGFAEVARRPGDFAIAGVATTIRHRDGLCESARLVSFGVGDGPVRLEAAEQRLIGQPIDVRVARRAGHAAAEDVSAPADDVHASAAYRRHLVTVLTEQVILEATDPNQRVQ